MSDGIKNNFTRRHQHTMYSLYFDGSCKGATLGASGVVIYKGKERIWQHSHTLVDQPMSCNVAEYDGLIRGLEWLIDNKLEGEPLMVFGDSKMVIMQMFGHWRIKAGIYKPLAFKCYRLVKQFTDIDGEWIPRERNEEADFLSTRYSF